MDDEGELLAAMLEWEEEQAAAAAAAALLLQQQMEDLAAVREEQKRLRKRKNRESRDREQQHNHLKRVDSCKALQGDAGGERRVASYGAGRDRASVTQHATVREEEDVGVGTVGGTLSKRQVRQAARERQAGLDRQRAARVLATASDANKLTVVQLRAALEAKAAECYFPLDPALRKRSAKKAELVAAYMATAAAGYRGKREALCGGAVEGGILFRAWHLAVIVDSANFAWEHFAPPGVAKSDQRNSTWRTSATARLNAHLVLLQAEGGVRSRTGKLASRGPRRFSEQLVQVVEGAQGGAAQSGPPEAVRVLAASSQRGEDGDQKIVEETSRLVASGFDPKDITVVTNDKKLTERIRELGATTRPTEWLLKQFSPADIVALLPVETKTTAKTVDSSSKEEEKGATSPTPPPPPFTTPPPDPAHLPYELAPAGHPLGTWLVD